MKVLAISYAKSFFQSDNPERKRMEVCAAHTQATHIIVFTKKTDSFEYLSTNALHIHPTNSKNRIRMLWDAYRIGRGILKEKGQWVITTQDPFESGILGYFLSRTTKIPLNVQEHGDVFGGSYWRKESLLNRIRFFVGRYILRHADTVRVVSLRMKDSMYELGVGKNRVYSLAVYTSLPVVNGRDHSTKQATIQNGSDMVTILSMARFVKQKNLLLLLNAFYKVHQTFPKVRLCLVGHGDNEQKLLRFVHGHNLDQVVSFVPWTESPQDYYAQADIYALSSNYEGWGRVLIEAMQAGVPIITTDVGCAHEVVKDNRHGYIVPVQDLDQFTEKLMLLVVDDRKRHVFGSQAKEDVQHVLGTVEEYARQWVFILEQTLSYKT